MTEYSAIQTWKGFKMKNTLMLIMLMIVTIILFAIPSYAANITDKNPMQLDTAGVITATPIYITQAIWSKVGSDGHELVFKEQSGGHQVGYGEGIAGTRQRIWGFELEATKLYLDTIDSGEVLLFWKPVPMGHNQPVVP